MDLHTVERFERVWIGFAIVMALLMGLAATYNVVRAVVPTVRSSVSQHVDIKNLAATPFGKPELKRLGFQTYELYMVAHIFEFTPSEIKLKAGDSLEMHLTSSDVIHGFQILGTTINVEVIPGEVATVAYRFKKPGIYMIVCNEYCGFGHHKMLARIVVTA
jgi:cytochrome c oxidase subunit II